MNVEQSTPLDKEPTVILQPLLVIPSFYRPPRKPPKEAPKPVKKRKHSKFMRLVEGMNLYDILTNMDSIQPQITLRQLLAILLVVGVSLVHLQFRSVLK